MRPMKLVEEDRDQDDGDLRPVRPEEAQRSAGASCRGAPWAASRPARPHRRTRANRHRHRRCGAVPPPPSTPLPFPGGRTHRHVHSSVRRYHETR